MVSFEGPVHLTHTFLEFFTTAHGLTHCEYSVVGLKRAIIYITDRLKGYK